MKHSTTILRAQLRDELRDSDNRTLDARVDRYLEINHQEIIGNHCFAAASSECINLYRDGHFISTVMSTQAVNEGILKFLADRNNLGAMKHDELMKTLVSNCILSNESENASRKIWGSFRNDVHHMNPEVAHIDFPKLALKNLQNLGVIEREIFGVDIENGKLNPKQPKCWDVENDGTVPVFLRLGI